MNKITQDYIEKTIKLARSGDTNAGLEYLELCMAAVTSGTIQPPLQVELLNSLQTLRQLLTDNPQRELTVPLLLECFLVRRNRGRPSEPFPDWHSQMMACDELLKRAEIKHRQRNEILRELTQTIRPKLKPHDDELDRIRAKYNRGAMTLLQREDLLNMAGDRLRDHPSLILNI